VSVPALTGFALEDLAPVATVAAHEGPVYVAAEHALYFTTVPRDRADGVRIVAIARLDAATGDVTTVVDDANAANGMTLDRDGRLVVCEQGGPRRDAAITLVDPRTGEREVLVDRVAGRPLNSPNDVAVGPDGAVWFTDPAYGWLQGFRPRPRLGDHVYRHDRTTGATVLVARGFDKPNGIALSPDGRRLYVGDSGRPRRVRVFDVAPDGGGLGRARVFAHIEPGYPDGLKTDRDGRVYASAADGVQIFGPDGRRVGEIPLPGAVNFAWGGPGRNVLFITTDTAVYAAVLTTQGA
jgi:gluconolactonase